MESESKPIREKMAEATKNVGLYAALAGLTLIDKLMSPLDWVIQNCLGDKGTENDPDIQLPSTRRDNPQNRDQN